MKKTAPLLHCHFLEREKNLPAGKSTNPESMPTSTSFHQITPCGLGHHAPCPKSPQNQVLTLEATLIAQRPEELLQLCNPKGLWVYLVSPIPSCENHNKNFVHMVFPCSFLPLTNPGAPHVVPSGMVFLLLLGTMRNKLSFQRQSSPNLVASPYLNKNKIPVTF